MAITLADYTTLRVGGEAHEFITATTEEELVTAVRDADEAGTPVFILGGGSNVLIGDDGFPGRVVRVATSGNTVDDSACGGSHLTIAAGDVWDDVVAHCVTEGWSGVEALSGIPGSVGATPIQNVGAYGAEVADVIASVRTWDRAESRIHTYFPSECGFGYRDSMFKRQPGRWVVLEVALQLPHNTLSAPIRYAELASRLGVDIGGRSPLADVRQAVLALRRSKGMVLDPADHDTWSAGSFFTNPILTVDDAAALPADAPRFALPDGRMKTSAAWLIQHAGFARGYGNDRAALSGAHTLALTNRGEASAEDIVALAREVRDGVVARCGIELVPEPVLVGCEL